MGTVGLVVGGGEGESEAKRRIRRKAEKEKKKERKKQLQLEKDLRLNIERVKYEDIKAEFHFINKFVPIYESSKSKIILAYEFVRIKIVERFEDGTLVRITMSPAHAHILSNLLNRLVNVPDEVGKSCPIRVNNVVEDSFITVTKEESDAGQYLKFSNKDSEAFIKLPLNKEVLATLETNLNEFVAMSGNADIPSTFRYEDEPKPRLEMQEIFGRLSAPPGFLSGCCWCSATGTIASCSCCGEHPWWEDMKAEFDRMGGRKPFFLENLLDDDYFNM